MLAPYRVVDLCDRRGWMASFLLAQLGAEVVLAEPPGGYPRDEWYAAYNRGKRSVTASGPAELAVLVAGADVVIHNRDSAFAVDLAALRAADPSLVTVSITPFGETGPKAAWRGDDLTLYAAGGPMSVTGDSDRPPVRVSAPQSWLHASSEAAVAALVALHARARDGHGQHVDLSAQQATAAAGLPAVLFGPGGMPRSSRVAGGVTLGPLLLRWVHATADGVATITLAFGPMIGPYTRRLFEWIHADGYCDDATLGKNWIDFALLLSRGEETLDELARLIGVISTWAATKTKQELMDAALERRLLIAPVSTVLDVLDSPQLAARGYWDEVDGVRYPGPMVQAGRTPLPRLGAAPAASGSVTGHAWQAPAVARPVPRPDAEPVAPLAGLKVLDLSWVAAAPLATRILAHWGATVVRVESSHRPCLARQSLGHRDDIPDQENGITWHAVNAGKLGLALDLGKPESRAVIADLARWADVAVEAFTPGSAAAMGFGYEQLRELNPSIVMLSSCMMGQYGPWRDFAGFGNLAASIAGFFDVTGWSDRLPAGPYMAYTDYTSPRFTLCALLAALDHRARTGEGQYLDFSQMEAATHFLAPAIVAAQSGTVRSRMGNEEPGVAPHGVYPCHGEDRWIAVEVHDDEAWRSLAVEMRRSDLAGLDAAARWERRAELDEVLGAWTARQDATGLQMRLQAHGICAHQVQNTGEMCGDPQLAHRGWVQWRPQPFARTALVDFPPYTLSRSPGDYAWAGPTYGQHAGEVLTGLLGYDDERITELAIAEALE
jgi:crotonobetainyl-CoA:carnitine CoA-transferase CaiB-like acyl-CoA transferase